MAHNLPDLVNLFDRLATPAADDKHRYVAQTISDCPHLAVGKGSGGDPALLIQVDASESPGMSPPITLEFLNVLHDVACRTQSTVDICSTKRFSVIRCTASDRQLREYFLRVLAAVVLALPASPTRRHVTDAVNKLVALFSRLSMSPSKTIQGLWAELLVISRSFDPSQLIRCWHATPEDRFDFSDGDERIEVKTVQGEIRRHHFSFDQLHPPLGTRAFVISLLVQRVGAGVTVLDLLDQIKSLIDDAELTLRLEDGVAKALGSDWRHANTIAFDREFAEQTLRIFDVASIPSVSAELPPEVSDIHFRVDLTGQQSLRIDDIDGRDGGLVSAAFATLLSNSCKT